MAEWKGELRLAFLDEDRVTFYLHPEGPSMEGLTPGRRYAAMFIEISDQETLQPGMSERKTVERTSRNPSNIAAILCKDGLFQQWATMEMKRIGRGNLPPSEETARSLVRFVCNIGSRSELDFDQAALVDFQMKVEVPFRRWKDLQT